MAVILNKANLVLKDANGNVGKIEQLSDRDIAKIKTAVSDVALVVNQSNHTPIEATTTNKGVVQLATSADVVAGASDKVVTAEQLHNSTTGTSALATENLARIDAVVTEAGIVVDHTNTNQLKTAVTTLISNATPATATSDTVGVVKPDNDTITIDSNGVLTATAQMPGVATNTNVGVVKPDGSTITVDSNGTLTATAQMPGVATTTNVGVVKPDGTTITVDGDGTLTCGGKNLVRSVNSITPDASGNVQLDGLVKSVNGVNADANGNVKGFFPSSTFISITVTNYKEFIAPTNGWMYIEGTKDASTSFGKVRLAISDGSDFLRAIDNESSIDTNSYNLITPLSKGEKVLFSIFGSNNVRCRFFYAQGEEA